MEPAGSVIVGRRDLVEQPASSGPTHALLVDLQRARSIAWKGYPPFRIPGVAPGTYNVFLVAADGSYGQGHVEVSEGGHEAEVVVDTAPGTRYSGTVVDAAGRPMGGASVRLLRTGWPDEVSTWLGGARTDAEGTFSLFGGLSLDALCEVTMDGRVVATQDVEAGERARVVCR